MANFEIEHPKTVSRTEWLLARKKLLTKEPGLGRTEREVDRAANK
jgi:hypothetical protein